MKNSLTTYGNKFKEYMARRKEERELEELNEKAIAKAELKENNKAYSNAYKEAAIEHMKDKAYNTMNDPNVHMSKRIAAINEYYKDHNRPKASRALQDISDHTYMTKYKREMRMEKMKMIKNALALEKQRLQNERYQKMMAIKERNTILNNMKAAKSILRSEKMKFRR